MGTAELNLYLSEYAMTGSTLEFTDLSLEILPETINGKAVEVVAFKGKITNGNAFQVNRKIVHLFDSNNYNIILDLSELEYVNSTGIAILFSIFQRVKENSGKISIGGIHPFLHNIFNLMDLPSNLDLHDTLDLARKNF